MKSNVKKDKEFTRNNQEKRISSKDETNLLFGNDDSDLFDENEKRTQKVNNKDGDYSINEHYERINLTNTNDDTKSKNGEYQIHPQRHKYNLRS